MAGVLNVSELMQDELMLYAFKHWGGGAPASASSSSSTSSAVEKVVHELYAEHLGPRFLHSRLMVLEVSQCLER